MTGKVAIIALAIVFVSMRFSDAMAEAPPKSALLPPVLPACISSAFGPRLLPNQPEAGTYHYGVDLPAPVGAAVVAAAEGSVIRVQRKGPGGLEMLVQHEGFVGIYSHFGSIAPAFAEGKRVVAAGEKLGVVGRTGVTSGAHLYFEMLVDGRPVDPAPYLRLTHCGGKEPPAMVNTHLAGGTTSPGRKYYQILLPQRDYYGWQRQ